MAESRIEIVALEALTYQGQTYAPGEVLEVRAIEAAAYHYQHKARYVTEAGPEPAAAAPAPSATRRRYRRRDLAPEEA